MHGDLRGFYKAPVTYAFSIAVGAASSTSLLFNRGHLLALDRDAVLSRSQYWRLFSSQLTFQNGLAVSLGLYFVFQFRVLERQLGSRKFGSILFFTLLISGVMQHVALRSVPSLTNTIPGGPYPVIGAFAVYYIKFIPKLHPRMLRVWGVYFTDKSSTYILMLVLFARDVQALLPFLFGSILGFLFSSTRLGRLRVPSFMCSIFSLLHPLFDVVPPSVLAFQRQRRALEARRRVNARLNPGGLAVPADAGQGFRDQLLPGAAGGAPVADGAFMLPPHMAAAPPSEDAIQQLTVGNCS